MIGTAGKKVSPKRLVVLGALGWGAIDAIIFNSSALQPWLGALHIPILWLILPLMAIVGVPVVGLVVSGNAWLQRESADEYRGRIFGALGTTSALMLTLGMGLSSLLGDRLGVVALLNLACVAIVIAAIVAQIRLPAPELRPADQPVTRTESATPPG